MLMSVNSMLVSKVFDGYDYKKDARVSIVLTPQECDSFLAKNKDFYKVLVKEVREVLDTIPYKEVPDFISKEQVLEWVKSQKLI